MLHTRVISDNEDRGRELQGVVVSSQESKGKGVFRKKIEDTEEVNTMEHHF